MNHLLSSICLAIVSMEVYSVFQDLIKARKTEGIPRQAYERKCVAARGG
jgi:hypothetical protein